MSPDEVASCRQSGIALGYDPVQIGWVRLDCEDDIGADASSPPGAGVSPYLFRPWREDDAAFLARTLSSPRLWRYLPEAFDGTVTPEAARDLIDIANGADHHHVRAVEFAGEVIGQIRLEYRDGDRTSAELSYWLAESHWGRGHGSTFVAHFVDECLRRNPDLVLLTARVHVENPASVRVLDKAGFTAVADADEGPWRLFLLDGASARRHP